MIPGPFEGARPYVRDHWAFTRRAPGRTGRRQFELTCSPRAMDRGACDARARELCGGDYETQHVGSAGSALISDGQGNYFATDDRVLLIACHDPRARAANR